MDDNEPLPLNSPYAAFLWAEAYRNASSVLEAQARRVEAGKFSHITRSANSAPLIIIRALAAEVYLKCLLYIDGKSRPKDGHNYKSIFDLLEVGTQKAVRAMYKEMLDTAVFPPDFHKEMEGVRLDFDGALEQAGGLFPKFRYGYEGTGEVTMAQGPLLGEALRNTILAIHPEWATPK